LLSAGPDHYSLGGASDFALGTTIYSCLFGACGILNRASTAQFKLLKETNLHIGATATTGLISQGKPPSFSASTPHSNFLTQIAESETI
jgi:hypothetical protein